MYTNPELLFNPSIKPYYITTSNMVIPVILPHINSLYFFATDIVNKLDTMLDYNLFKIIVLICYLFIAIILISKI